MQTTRLLIQEFDQKGRTVKGKTITRTFHDKTAEEIYKQFSAEKPNDLEKLGLEVLGIQLSQAQTWEEIRAILREINLKCGTHKAKVVKEPPKAIWKATRKHRGGKHRPKSKIGTLKDVQEAIAEKADKGEAFTGKSLAKDLGFPFDRVCRTISYLKHYKKWSVMNKFDITTGKYGELIYTPKGAVKIKMPKSERFQCEICGKRFVSLDKKTKHVGAKHPKEAKKRKELALDYYRRGVKIDTIVKRTGYAKNTIYTMAYEIGLKRPTKEDKKQLQKTDITIDEIKDYIIGKKNAGESFTAQDISAYFNMPYVKASGFLTQLKHVHNWQFLKNHFEEKVGKHHRITYTPRGE